MAIKISGTTVIDDSRNITNVGSVGDSNTVYFGDGSGLSGIQAGSSTFTASGAISNGDVVIINTDGTVSTPTVTNGQALTATTPTQFISARVFNTRAVYDTNSNKVVIAFRDSNSSGKAVVGTVNNVVDTMTFGIPAQYETGTVSEVSAAFDSNANKVVIAYTDSGNSSYGTAVVGTVSGDNISFGTPVVFNSGSTDAISTVFDSNANKIVIAYKDSGNSSYGTAIVGTVSGTSISFGSETVFNNSGSTNYISAVFNPDNNKIVIAYRDDGDSSYGKMINGTVSGTSISFGSERSLASKRTDYIATTYDTTANRIVVAYNDDSSNQRGKVKVAEASGDNFSFGSETEFNGTPTVYISLAYDSTSNRVMIAYRGEYSSSQQGYVLPATVSGSSISIGSSVQFDSNLSNHISSVYDPDANRTIVAYLDDTTDVGNVVVASNSTTDLTTENYIGIAAEAISNAATGSITMVTGINASQSGLTAGQQYFVNADGSISENTTSLLAGTAISATKLIVKR